MNTYQPEYAASTYPLTDITNLAAQWQELESKADNPFFLSWQWIGAWLTAFQSQVTVIAVHYNEVQLVALGLLVSRNTRRHGVLSSKCLYLHQTGLPESDQIWIEYNGFLTDKEHTAHAEQIALRFIREHLNWDEWVVGAIEESKLNLYCKELNTSSHLLWEAPCYGIDLVKLRNTAQPYLQTLSANTRYQINRSQRLYEQHGRLKLLRPDSLSEALDWFNKIGPLHIRRWGDGLAQSGFANPLFVQFHHQLIKQSWNQFVDIVALELNGMPIAFFYNFIYRRRVYFYLAGLKVEQDSKLKPGLLGHAICIEDYVNRGIDFYDFMGGEERYKSQLGICHSKLVRVTLQRNQFKFLLEQQARKVKHQLFGTDTAASKFRGRG
ncbi:protein involved in cellulose biosynthesis (CelD)-like protein [Alishewanella agri BL06]|uniref:Protein involved in cellulose biosynthesis (CelD)-like protein n=1 Tax=Alishewanella agri BL06 TaxID=1195246 RepID=I9P653_9ALTE|nr:GNAT family N-acetyltransferase [Alishewanella agri]EIW90349.1 protein involved in cellulose biosynthesis (CelD)-like protein [Alishewanella agri BL06]